MILFLLLYLTFGADLVVCFGLSVLESMRGYPKLETGLVVKSWSTVSFQAPMMRPHRGEQVVLNAGILELDTVPRGIPIAARIDILRIIVMLMLRRSARSRAANTGPSFSLRAMRLQPLTGDIAKRDRLFMFLLWLNCTLCNQI